MTNRVHKCGGHYGFEIVWIHWSDHPLRDEAWYEAQKQRMTAHERAVRLDISYEESAVGRVVPGFKITDVLDDMDFKPNNMMLWWDFGFVDATSIGFVELVPVVRGGERVNVLRVRDWVDYNFSNYQQVAQNLRARLTNLGYHGSTSRLYCVGDPAVKAREQSSGLSLQHWYAEEGFNINAAPAGYDCRHVWDVVNSWHEDGRIEIHADAVPLQECFQFWEWPKDLQGNPKQNATQPVHNRFSHAGKAFEYGFVTVCMGEAMTKGFNFGGQLSGEAAGLTAGLYEAES